MAKVDRPRGQVDIAGIRKQLGLSVDELARRLGVDIRTVYRWQRGGASPRGSVLVMIERLLQERLLQERTPKGDVRVLACLPMQDARRAEWGRSAWNAMRLAKIHLLQKDGIRIELECYETGSIESENFASKFDEELHQRLLQIKPDVVVGPISSFEVNLALAQAEHLNIPLIALAATSTRLGESEYLFRTCFSDSDQGKKLADLAGSAGHIASVEFGNDLYASGLADEFSKAAKVPVEKRISTSPGALGFKAAIAKLQGVRPLNVVMVAGGFHEVGEFVSLLRTYREFAHTKVLSGDACHSPALFIYLDEEEKDFTIATHFVIEANDRSRTFAIDYAKTFDYFPALAAALGYDALLAVGAAADIRRRSDSAKTSVTFREALTQVKVQGVTGMLDLSKRHATMKEVYLLDVLCGRFVPHDTKPKGSRQNASIYSRNRR